MNFSQGLAMGLGAVGTVVGAVYGGPAGAALGGSLGSAVGGLAGSGVDALQAQLSKPAARPVSRPRAFAHPKVKPRVVKKDVPTATKHRRFNIRIRAEEAMARSALGMTQGVRPAVYDDGDPEARADVMTELGRDYEDPYLLIDPSEAAAPDDRSAMSAEQISF